MSNQLISEARINALTDKISALIESARNQIATTVNLAEVYTKYYVGKYIIEGELEGNYRATYGKKVLKQVSERLYQKFGKGWSVETLTNCRRFYSVYSTPQISSTPFTKSVTATTKNFVNAVYEIQEAEKNSHQFILSWSHYLVLMRIEDANARSFYEIECARENWTVRWLQRQVNSSLYERIALSKDKDEILRLAHEGQTVSKPTDIIKNPITLEFLGLKPDTAYSETKLETAIINKMQKFLLELGKGFLFESRQKRFTFDEESFFVDLVFYNRLLQCYVLIDLKIDKLTHQDLGQMQMYVNYYDRYVKQEFEKPTIGILLCKEKKDALIELTLPKDANIYAAQYALYLPDKKILQSQLQSWIAEFEEFGEDDDNQNAEQ